MFEVGEYIVYNRSGICRVEEITKLSLAGVDRNREYYVLVPVGNQGSRVYVPVDKEPVRARRLMSRADIMALMDEMPEIEEIGIRDEKQREARYKEAMGSGDCRQWVGIIKTLYLRKQSRQAQGKKMVAVDERYLKMAEDALYGEMAFVLGKEKKEMEPLIMEHIQKMKV